ncbi:TetR/AcrR family transcriptional regulator [Phytoactinopolyspora endophytica]|uniref:TetR/AcrR family transcriptional regulator n=1 Tax=Phytoactinopolyspora endophytica TaxID=1642495 RepID=UPI00101CA81F|nr:TetR/AcrR family transcriptional regulator [Phytoactinopolyspora endophytica]
MSTSDGASGDAVPRRPYHHGDLRNALIDAGVELAAQGGPAAVGVRPAARIVGVTPTAAYRHFSAGEELLQAVRDHAFDHLAGAMRDNIARIPAAGDPATQAIHRLHAIARAYIEVAPSNPGLFQAATSHAGLPPVATADATPTAFGMLVQTLDDLVDIGVLPADRRPLAEIVAWSAVHGFARLIADGPLGQLPSSARNAASERVIEMVSNTYGRPRADP